MLKDDAGPEPRSYMLAVTVTKLGFEQPRYTAIMYTAGAEPLPHNHMSEEQRAWLADMLVAIYDDLTK